MYADAAVFASARLKPARTRLMTVEIDSSLLRSQTAPAQVQTLANKTISGSHSILTPVVSNPPQNPITSPTSLLSAPSANDSIINRKADPAQGLYQTCATLRKRLKDVPDFEHKFLMDEDDGDPVQQLWRIFQKGSSLCVLFNALQPANMIEEQYLAPDLATKNICKAACFHFLQGIKEELHMDGEEAFIISNLWSEDTNGFVKVTKAVARVLDELQARDLLLKRNDVREQETADAKPMDNRSRVIQELVETERKYVQDLEILQDFMTAVQSQEALAPDLVHGIFLNLNSLVDFQRRFLIRVETVYAQPPEQQRWGQIMVSHENSFDVYEPYCANFNTAQDLAVQESAKLSRVAHPVAQAGLTAFLIKPVQRICKYPLLLRDMIKYSQPEQQEELREGNSAIERVNSKVNEAIRKVDMRKVTDDLMHRVEDWKGHRLEQLGNLLLTGQFTVIKGDGKGDLEREYHIYLFQKILLCCKEVGPSSKKQTKTMSMGKKGSVLNNQRAKSKLQLKGRIFMQNVTDIVWMAKNGNYTLQIFWKGDPGVEDFVIKHRNEETLNQWKNLLQKQVDICHQMEASGRTSGGVSKTSNTEFIWMQHSASDPNDYGARSEEEVSEDEDGEGNGLVYTPSYSTSRNGSTTSLRSRAATNESGGPPLHLSGLPSNPHPARMRPYTHQSQGSTSSQQPLLSLQTYNTANGSPGAQSPERNMSYFSPTSETPMGRASGVTGYPFPRQPTPNYHDDVRFNAAPMARTASREGSGLAASQSSAGQRLQRPSLPGMSPAAAMQNRMRSASSPSIHHIPTQAQLARSPGMIPPMPVPPLPQTYQAYTGGPAVINRSQNSSPTSPMPGMHPPPRHASPSVHGNVYSNSGYSVPTQPARGPQVKLKVEFLIGNERKHFAIIVPFNISYGQLLDRIERKLGMFAQNSQSFSYIPSLQGSITIRYTDEDDDKILMNSDDDVQMAFENAAQADPPNNSDFFLTLNIEF